MAQFRVGIALVFNQFRYSYHAKKGMYTPINSLNNISKLNSYGHRVKYTYHLYTYTNIGVSILVCCGWIEKNLLWITVINTCVIESIKKNYKIKSIVWPGSKHYD